MSNQDVWSVGMTIDEAEKNIIERSLKFFGYNKTMTARSLGISVRGLDNKISKFEIPVNKKLAIQELEENEK